MLTSEALQVLIDRRDDRQVVITNQGSSREWPKLSDHPLDFHFLPSAMGAAIPLGLGIALAQPDREVLVISGDGSLLMNLGSLVTVAGSGARNITVVVLDNRAYAVTGCQKMPATGHDVSYVDMARAAGFKSSEEFVQLDQWRDGATTALTLPGPRFISLKVAVEHHTLAPDSLQPISQRMATLRQELAH